MATVEDDDKRYRYQALSFAINYNNSRDKGSNKTIVELAKDFEKYLKGEDE